MYVNNVVFVIIQVHFRVVFRLNLVYFIVLCFLYPFDVLWFFLGVLRIFGATWRHLEVII